MIRLLVFTPSFATRGGVERIIHAIHDELPRFGIDVTVALAKGRRFHDPRRYASDNPGLRYVEIDGLSGSRQGRLEGIDRAIDSVSPDVVLIARLGDVYEIVSRRKLRGDRLRLAVTIQGYEADYLHDLDIYSAFVDLCVTGGELVARGVRELTSLPPARIRYIPGGIRPALREHRHRDPAAPLRLGYVGRLATHQKRILDLVETLVLVDASGVPFLCDIAGSGPEEELLREQLRARGLDSRVNFHGWMTTEELYERIYPDLDVFVHFAAWEGIPIAPREAMANGIVPVLSRFVGSRCESVFRDGENALMFDVGDVAEAARLIRELYENDDLRKRLSAEASRSMSGIQSHQGAVAAWAEAFHEIAAQPPSVGKSLPRLGHSPAGRLDRFLPAPLAERVRSVLGRSHLHTDPGGEWPHAVTVVPSSFERAVRELAERAGM